MKKLNPAVHGAIDYTLALSMITSPWMFGFSRDRKARLSAVMTGVGILGLSLFTRYPLGVVRVISFPTHGVIETLAAIAAGGAPWTMGFSSDRAAKLIHLMAGLGTLGVVSMTDYNQRRADMSLPEAITELIGSGPQPQETYAETRKIEAHSIAAGTS